MRSVLTKDKAGHLAGQVGGAEPRIVRGSEHSKPVIQGSAKLLALPPGRGDRSPREAACWRVCGVPTRVAYPCVVCVRGARARGVPARDAGLAGCGAELLSPPRSPSASCLWETSLQGSVRFSLLS